MADDKRAAGAVRVARLDARRGETDDAAGIDQEIDAFGDSSPWPPLMRTLRGPSARICARLRFHLGFVVRQRRIGERGGFVQVRRHHQRARDEIAAQGSDAPRRQQPVAGGRDHHRIEHDVLRVVAREAFGDGLDRRHLRQHADLDRVDVEIGEHRIDLRGDEIRRHVVNGGDALRVLRGQRGDHRGAIDAERAEGFEIGLDAGAAA